ncbi:hypothetical protein GCM10011371_16440 [Novosphingobium marinum]|uniref:DUF4126 domain-containing protein n=1 Tax=Novosphingobium marinum TaxID=1514948 RepID=A0A7Y9XWD7_9SPHN|nr:DUF4126 domain-containing protein [Novosphingobium marinum]NYH95757.1 hypothetical protein [Novosphingobium marinum]GGC29650.1 hypothetical protein GCM10011371_16440 [Novosphingobium marinum]
MDQPLGIVEILGLAASLSLLSGWRLYLTILATGIAMRMGALPLPDHLEALQALANPWVMGISGIAAIAELFADKVAWLDSLWDGVHSVVRPLGGALLTLAVVDPADPVTQVIAFILGGGGAFLAHGGKAGARAVVNTSPEPFSNVAVSTVEDVATGGLLLLAFQFPVIAALIALVLLALTIWFLIVARRFLKRLFGREGAPVRK